MTTIGAFEAKTQLPALLDRVARGEKITITRPRFLAAVLVPVGILWELFDKEIVEGMRALRKGVKPGSMSVKEMVNEGRRY